MSKSVDKDFSSFIASGGSHSKTKVLVITSSADPEDKVRIHRDSVNYYTKEGCRVINAGNALVYDCENGVLNFSTMSTNMKLKLDKELDKLKGKELTIVLSSHGNIFWFLGESPGQEREAMQKFSNELRALEEKYNVKVTRVVLDGCFTASELKDKSELPADMDHSSPARILSEYMGSGVQVIGLNGKAASGCVNTYNERGERIKSTYADNAVVFRDGKVTKGSKHSRLGDGLRHSTNIINLTHAYYSWVFGGRNGDLYRTDSFSEGRM